MKRLAILCADYPKVASGIGDYSHRLCNALVKSGVKVCVVSTEHPEIQGGDCFLGIRWRLREIPGLIRFLRENRLQYVNIQYPAPLYGKYNLVPHLICMVLRLSGYKIISTLHEYSNNNILRRISMEIFVAFSNRLVLTVDHELAAITKSLPFLGKHLRRKARIIPIGSNIDPCNTPVADLHRSRYISYFGIFYPSKGAERVIDVMERIDKACPGKYTFRFIGGTHPYYADYYKEFSSAAKSRLSRVEFYVNRDNSEIRELVCTTHLAVLGYNDGVSLRRGSFLAFIENGIPVMTNRGKQSADLKLVEGKGLYYVDEPGFEVEKIMSDLDRFASYRANYNDLRAFSAGFDFKHIAKAYIDVMNSLVVD